MKHLILVTLMLAFIGTSFAMSPIKNQHTLVAKQQLCHRINNNAVSCQHSTGSLA